MSGDGSHYRDGMEGALPVPSVAISAPSPTAEAQAKQLRATYPCAHVVVEPAIIMVYPDGPWSWPDGNVGP